MQTSPLTITDVERWNDTFARDHDIDEYYARSGMLIRWIERRRLADIRTMLDVLPDDKVLEVGCGGGHVLRMFPENELVGTDVSGEMIRKARKNLQGFRVKLHKGELDELNLPRASLGRMICTEVLEHVVDPDRLLSQMAALLTPGGRIVITLPNDRLIERIKSFIYRSGLRHLPPFRRISWGGDRYHLHAWTAREMIALLSSHFSILEKRAIPAPILPIRYAFACTTLT